MYQPIPFQGTFKTVGFMHGWRVTKGIVDPLVISAADGNSRNRGLALHPGCRAQTFENKGFCQYLKDGALRVDVGD